MMRGPFNPMPNTIRRQQRRPVEPPKKNDPIFENAAFSPQLSLMLSMVFKDGFTRNTGLDMLKNIYPYVEPADKAIIDKLFGIRDFSVGYHPHPSQGAYPATALSKQERDLNLLRILKKYAGQDTARLFDRMERAILMQVDMSRMMNRLENLRNMKVSSPDDLLNTLETFMPAKERLNIRNMSNMMQLFKNMNNFKPEDMMKMFGGPGGLGNMFGGNSNSH